MWSLRMESKHTYFKGIVKASKNFKNISKTCARRHELAQVCYRYQGLFPKNRLDIPSDSSFLRDCKLDTSDEAFHQTAMDMFGEEALLVRQLKVYGTLYTAGMIVVLRKPRFGELNVGVIEVLLVSDRRVFFYCKSYRALQSRHNYYISQERCNHFQMYETPE